MILLLIAASCQLGRKKESTTIDQRPNILLIVADDMGYSDIGPYGGEIHTPTLDMLAEQGVLLSNFHVLPTCSPTRSVLLSGTDNHIAGLGSMAEITTPKQKGKPGYEGFLNNTVAHLPQILKNAGYHTYMSGKWHLGHVMNHRPINKGFEETFALLPGGGSHWADRLPLSPPQTMVYARNGEVIDNLPVDFYSTKNYTNYLLEWLERDKNDQQPFFAYLSYTAPHDPLHAPKTYIDKYKGKYDNGFNVLRTERFESLKALGIIPKTANIFPWSGPVWGDLTAEEKKESSRDMEVYAAMIEYMDEQISRILSWLKENNKMDNTFIIFFSDNGANGAMNTAYPGQTEEFINSFDNSLENKGLPGSYTEMGPAWATASMAPHRLFKSFTTEGGIISPCIVKLPSTISSELKMNKAFTHVSDIMPTFLELAEASHPSNKNSAVPQMMGKSLLPLLTGKKEEIHFNDGIGYELHGMRAYIKNEWKIVNLPKPFGKGDWELFNLEEDPAESNDLSKQYPEKRDELISAWEEYSKNVGIIFDPLDIKGIMEHD
jgi:arylsulfatase